MFAFSLRKSPTKNRHSRPIRNRQLGFVTLEERNLLTALDPLPIPPEPTDPPPEPPSDIAPIGPTGDTFDGLPPAGEGDGGGDGTGGDGTIGGGTIGGGGTVGDGGDGGGETGGGGSGENQAPVLVEFQFTEAEGYYQFSGYVIDDVDPTGLYVYFDGLLSGYACVVQQGGYFNYGITLNEPTGQVFATFIDGGSLWSNQAVVTL